MRSWQIAAPNYTRTAVLPLAPVVSADPFCSDLNQRLDDLERSRSSHCTRPAVAHNHTSAQGEEDKELLIWRNRAMRDAVSSYASVPSH